MRKSSEIGWVYFIVDDARHALKIGYATDVAQRRQILQTGNPNDLRVEYFVRGTKRLEKALHERFRHISLGREWFFFGEELLGFVDTLEGLKRNHVDRLIRSGELTVETHEDVYDALDDALIPEETILNLEIEDIGPAAQALIDKGLECQPARSDPADE